MAIPCKQIFVRIRRSWWGKCLEFPYQSDEESSRGKSFLSQHPEVFYIFRILIWCIAFFFPYSHAVRITRKVFIHVRLIAIAFVCVSRIITMLEVCMISNSFVHLPVDVFSILACVYLGSVIYDQRICLWWWFFISFDSHWKDTMELQRNRIWWKKFTRMVQLLFALKRYEVGFCSWIFVCLFFVHMKKIILSIEVDHELLTGLIFSLPSSLSLCLSQSFVLFSCLCFNVWIGSWFGNVLRWSIRDQFYGMNAILFFPSDEYGMTRTYCLMCLFCSLFALSLSLFFWSHFNICAECILTNLSVRMEIAGGNLRIMQFWLLDGVKTLLLVRTGLLRTAVCWIVLIFPFVWVLLLRFFFLDLMNASVISWNISYLHPSFPFHSRVVVFLLQGVGRLAKKDISESSVEPMKRILKAFLLLQFQKLYHEKSLLILFFFRCFFSEHISDFFKREWRIFKNHKEYWMKTSLSSNDLYTKRKEKHICNGRTKVNGWTILSK